MADALDPQAVLLAKAIRQHESGGNFNAKGKSGESGAYQFMPSTWKTWAGKHLGDPNAAMTPENQNKVAYSQIKSWKDQGYKPDQIASLWNSGKPDWQGKVGTNQFGVAYNTPAYVKSVGNIYTQMKGKVKTPGTQLKATPGLTPPGGTDSNLLRVGNNIVDSRTPEQKNLEMGMDVAKGVAGGIDKAYGFFKNLPGVKQFAQGVGGIVNTAGQVLGEGFGALGETGIQTVRAAQGKGFDAGKIAQTATETSQSTGQFGKKIGEEGAPAALLGEYGGFIPNTAMAFSQGVQGTQDIAQGIQEKDPAKMLSGGISLGSGLIGGKSAVREARAGGGMLVSPNVEATKQSLIQQSGKLGPKAQAVTSAVLKPIDTYRAPKLMEKATQGFREVLRPDKGELKRIEIKRGGNIDDSYKLMAENGIKVDKTADSKLNTKPAIETQVDPHIDALDVELDKKLASRPDYKIDVKDIKEKAIQRIDAMDITEVEKDAKKAEVSRILNGEIEKNKTVITPEVPEKSVQGMYGPPVKVKGTPEVSHNEITGEKANQLKRRMWRMGYDNNMPNQQAMARLVGNVIKDDIANNFKEEGVDAINKEMADWLQMRSVLENAHGRVIAGGKMGYHFANLMGATVGSLAGGVFGPVGHVVGGLAGKAVSDEARNYFTDPARLTKKASKQAAQSKAFFKKK